MREGPHARRMSRALPKILFGALLFVGTACGGGGSTGGGVVEPPGSVRSDTSGHLYITDSHRGGFAEELRLPSVNLLAVPDDISDIAATFTEPLAAAFEQLALAVDPEAFPDRRLINVLARRRALSLRKAVGTLFVAKHGGST